MMMRVNKRLIEILNDQGVKVSWAQFRKAYGVLTAERAESARVQTPVRGGARVQARSPADGRPMVNDRNSSPVNHLLAEQ
jgi:hypothetical protein